MTHKKQYIKFVESIYRDFIQFKREHEILPTENTLAHHYKVSRTTIRRSLEEINIKGHIYMIQGNGCYVSHQEKKNNL